MPTDYLHHHKEYPELLRIVADDMRIEPYLVEKDYWLMHVLYGLKKQDFDFKLKGGTSLSKGYRIIDRFSEDIDIYIKPHTDLGVNENPKNQKPNAIASKKAFYGWLAINIKIDGLTSVERDILFDDTDYYRSGGIRLHYPSITNPVEGVKEGVLLEAGFDIVTPNQNFTIGSWALDKASISGLIGKEVIDNRAIDMPCYHPGYIFVEKLQTVARMFRQEQEGAKPNPNLMRQYYDIYSLLANEYVQSFIGTREYHAHKEKRFSTTDAAIPIADNPAYFLPDHEMRSRFIKRYQDTAKLYYNGQPAFEDILERIKQHIDKL
jgi:Nucleotidyl transferase AbiEii toxin, Type IV TA system